MLFETTSILSMGFALVYKVHSILVLNITVAQGKRDGLISRRSQDRNLAAIQHTHGEFVQWQDRRFALVKHRFDSGIFHHISLSL